MRKQFLIRVNALLAAASLMLAGCHTQKKVTPTESQESNEPTIEQVGEPEIKPLYGVPAEPIMCKYGVPPQLIRSAEQDDEAK